MAMCLVGAATDVRFIPNSESKKLYMFVFLQPERERVGKYIYVRLWGEINIIMVETRQYVVVKLMSTVIKSFSKEDKFKEILHFYFYAFID